MREYTVFELSDKFHVNPETVRRWIRSNELKATIVSKKKGHIVKEKDLIEFLNSNHKYARFMPDNNVDLLYVDFLEEIIHELEHERESIDKRISYLKKLQKEGVL